jgi:hypothetical protein
MKRGCARGNGLRSPSIRRLARDQRRDTSADNRRVGHLQQSVLKCIATSHVPPSSRRASSLRTAKLFCIKLICPQLSSCDSPHCVCLQPVCEHVSRPRSFNVDAWDCIYAHIAAKARNGCLLHAETQKGLYKQRHGEQRFGCAACTKSFWTRREALHHLGCERDAAHAVCKQCGPRQQMKSRVNEMVSKESRAETAIPSLYSAAKAGNAAALDELLSSDDINLNTAHDDGATALMTAAEAGHAECVMMLADDSRCDCERRNIYGQRAIHLAAQHGRYGAVEVLWPHVDLEATANGKTAAQHARSVGHVSLANRLASAARQAQLARIVAALERQDGHFDSAAQRLEALCASLKNRLPDEDHDDDEETASISR